MVAVLLGSAQTIMVQCAWVPGVAGKTTSLCFAFDREHAIPDSALPHDWRIRNDWRIIAL